MEMFGGNAPYRRLQLAGSVGAGQTERLAGKRPFWAVPRTLGASLDALLSFTGAIMQASHLSYLVDVVK